MEVPEEKASQKPDWLTASDREREEREEAECEVCHTGNFVELDMDGEEILEGQLEVVKHSRIKIVANLTPAGSKHWLIIPRKHIRDIEHLLPGDLELLQEMGRVRDSLVQRHCPNIPPEKIHCGYHRGQRPNDYMPLRMPDIISVKHLHLHVIAEPRLLPFIYKFHPSNSILFKSEADVLKLVEEMVEKGNDARLGQHGHADATLEEET
ncbi:HIT-like domain-containing protein [Trichoderma novae-zelandiae]